MRKFYTCVTCKPGEDYCEFVFDIIQNESAFVFDKDSANHEEYYNIKKGDIIILSYLRNFVAYGEAKGVGTRESVEGFTLTVPVSEWYFFDEKDKSLGIDRYGVGFAHSGSNRDIIKQVNPTFGLEKLEQINPNTILLNKIKIDYNMPDLLLKALPLLDYKNQIILQGPPGTGKTRLAKIIGEKLTAEKSQVNPITKINEFINSFKVTDSVTDLRNERKKLIGKFATEFPIEDVKNLNLENYCIGTGTNDSFCWWLERGLKPLGYYFPGSARSYLVYWSKSKNEYSKHGKFLKDVDDNKVAITKIANYLSKFLTSRNFDEAIAYFGDSFLLKLLHTYFPNEFAPINSVVCLNNVLKLLGLDAKGMNSYQKNQAVKNYFDSTVKTKNLEVNIDEFVDYLFQTFDLKGHVELKNDTLYTKGEMKIIQFHPAYSYEDFVRGIEVSVTNSEKPEYKVVNKVLAEFAQKAFENNNSKYVLIIDEINRANLASVLGELIYALEYRYDPNKPDETSVESMYKLDEVDEIESDIHNKLKLPPNLKIIGTMNTADRSVGHIDYAIRRRFAFVDVLPEIEPVHKTVIDKFKSVASLFVNNFDAGSEKWIRSEHMAADFQPHEVMIGHSYFICKKEGSNDDEEDTKAKEILDLKMEFEVVPILKEYIKDGILNDTPEVKAIINGLIS